MVVNKSRNAPPKAGVLIEALRGLGYSTATALADIIDNSLAAHASEVKVIFSWKWEASTIAVLDNGRGMDDSELDLAMRLGVRSPLDVRASDDLGRFGLGLKTASFSQARRLTVASRKNGKTNCLQWDLDVLTASTDDGWYLLEGPAKGSERFLAPLDEEEHGTLVLWEKLDRIITPGLSEQDFLDLIDKVEFHLAMVFHRYLCGVRPILHLTINERVVEPWDPFIINHSATWSSPIERIVSVGGVVEVQCHVLPHKDRLDAKDHATAAGPDGWTAHQGFYVYRNERLLVAGSWLGLGRGRSWTKEEAHRLARIRLDISNTADVDWKIDVRKSMARPPVVLRERLTRLAEDTRERSRRVFAHRGLPMQPRSGEPLIQAWRVEHVREGIRYRIDNEHPAVRAVLDIAVNAEPQVKAMLRVIEETVPVQRIWLDTAENRETPITGFNADASSEVIEILEILYQTMVDHKGMTHQMARDCLMRTEPFNKYPDLVAALPDWPECKYREGDDSAE